MVAPVHYAKPTDDGMYEFYATLGRRTGLPIIIYNVVPINPLSPELLCRLVEIKEVVGVKQSGGTSTRSRKSSGSSVRRLR